MQVKTIPVTTESAWGTAGDQDVTSFKLKTKHYKHQGVKIFNKCLEVRIIMDLDLNILCADTYRVKSNRLRLFPLVQYE